MAEARCSLSEAHDFLVSCCLKSLSGIPASGPRWGIEMKRYHVNLNTANRPGIIDKDEERFGEVVNMIATIERLMDALMWFQHQSEFQNLSVASCHPSTSSMKGSNDLMLKQKDGDVVVLCEVCDVASVSAGQNGKERKDIKSLGCTYGVPSNGVRRFLCTSSEFARAIQSPKRKWNQLPYRYKEHLVGNPDGTVMVEVVSP